MATRSYNNNKIYTGSKHGKLDVVVQATRPAMKKGPQPTDMGTTSGKAQAARFYKGGK